VQADDSVIEAYLGSDEHDDPAPPRQPIEPEGGGEE
jgi:hypothetical protein